MGEVVPMLARPGLPKKQWTWGKGATATAVSPI